MLAGPRQREIIFEASTTATQNMLYVQDVLLRSNVKCELISLTPGRLRMPATTRSLTILLTLLEEGKPEGTLTLDGGLRFNVDEEGLSRLRRIVIRTLEKAADERNYFSKPFIGTRPSSTQSNESFFGSRKKSTRFDSNFILVLTTCLIAFVAILIGFGVLLGFEGKIGQFSLASIFGISVVGVFSLMLRYVSSFKVIQ
jgi:hypothetical protein